MDRTAREIAAFVASTLATDLHPEIAAQARRHLLDGLGCAIGGFKSAPATIAQRAAARMKGEPGATLWASDRETTPEMAAFANTVALRYLDFNDTYISKSGLHPSDVLPALVAIGEASSASGRALVAAIVAAYDVMGAFADATDIRERGWDQGILTAIAVAAAGAALAGGGEEEIAQAASIAAVSDVPTRQTRVGELAMWKGCATAAAARNGVFAAQLALDGMTAPTAAFDGYHGLAEQVTGPLNLQFPARPGAALAGTCLKYHPSEYHSQAPLDLLARLRPSLSVSEIESIRIGTYWVVVDEISEPAKWTPTSRETADHSLPYLTATYLLHGDIWTDSYLPTRLSDPEVLALMRRITITEVPEFTAAYPDRLLSEYEITLRSGERLSERTVDPRGHPRNPMSQAEVAAKFRRLARDAGLDAEAQAIAEAIDDLDRITVRDLATHLAFQKTGRTES